MAEKWTQAAIQALIDNEVQESLNLDYKAAGALEKADGKKIEITKDVSALANADGGTLIYGVAEYREPDKRHLPERIDPIDQAVITKEWLENVIGGIRPPLDGVVITPVPLDTGANHVAYVVEVPKGTTAHQALDKRYYKRRNFKSEPMEDYEIRDVMGRLQHPKIEIGFRIEIDSVQDGSWIGVGVPNEANRRTQCMLKITAKNVGPVYAQYVNAFITLHYDLLPEETKENKQPEVGDGQLVCTEEFDNTVRDVTGGAIWKPEYGPRRYCPILPGLSDTWEIELRQDLPTITITRDDVVVRWIVHADNAQRSTGQMPFRTIPRIDKRMQRLG